MLAWLAFILLALVWSAWLFGNVFSGKKRIVIYLTMLVISSTGAVVLYYSQGAHKQLEETTELHDRLKGVDLKTLSKKVVDKEITLQQLLTELRLRSEADPNNFELWRQFGDLFLSFGDIARAEQAFVRALSLRPETEVRLEFSRYYTEQGSPEAYQQAERHISVVLIDEPNHEGALLLQGINYFKQKKFQQAIHYWQRLLKFRESGSESAQLIQQQIDLAQRQLKLEQLNHISVVIKNVDSLLLTRYKKAFLLVRSKDGGPPVAVKSFKVSELNKPLTLTPDNVMLPGVDLWQAQKVYVEVRLSQSGLAQAEAGDRFGRTDLLNSLTPSKTFHIEITDTVE